MKFRFDVRQQFTATSSAIRARFSLAAVAPAAVFGAALFTWALLFWTRFGGAIEGRFAVLCGMTLGFIASKSLSGAPTRLVAGTAALWCLAQPLFADFSASLVGLFPLSFVETSAGQICLSAIGGVIAFTPGVAFATSLCRSNCFSSAVGFTSGVLVALLLSLILPLYCLLGLAVIGFAVLAWQQPSAIAKSPAWKGLNRFHGSELALTLAAGLLAGVALRFVGQWYLWTSWTWAAVLLAGGAALAVRVRWSAGAITAISAGVLLSAYSAIVYFSFAATVATDRVSFLLLMTTLFAVSILFGPAIAVRSTCSRGGVERLLLVGVGIALGMPAALSPVVSLLLVVFVGCGATFRSAGRVRRSLAVAGAGLAIVGVSFGSYAPELLPRVLHSSNAFAMTRAGEPWEEIFGSDESRLVTIAEFPDGVATAWSTRGIQTITCKDGMLDGMLTTNDELGPRIGADVLSVVLPMVCHDEPSRIAIVGVGSGEPVLTAVEFGQSTVEVIDRGRAIQFLQNHSADRRSKWQNEQLVVRNIPPRWAFDLPSLGVDILLANPGDAGSIAAAGTTTTTSVRGLRRHLRPGGIACQRLHAGALDAEAVLRLAAAYQEVFHQAHLFEIGPGQWLAIGTDRETPLFDFETVERLQREDVRFALAKAGYDWSVVMNLFTLGPDEMTDAIAESGTRPSSVLSALETRTQSWLTRRRDSERFGTFATQVSPFVKRPIDRITDTFVLRDIEARLADAQESTKVQGETADQFWAYRATIKSRLKSRPRPAVQQVAYSDKPTLHPEDARRKLYLATLGAAIAEQDVASLEPFIFPYDPLVSFFVHGEAARICDEAGDEQAALKHRIASVYKTSNDVSVVGALGALEAICEGHGGSDTHRYDLAQGLLEQTRRRWHLRIHRGEMTNATLRTLADTVDRAKETLAMLDTVVAENPELAENWARRKPILRRDLITRLRVHQRAAQEKNIRIQQMRAAVKLQRNQRSAEISTDGR